MGMLSWSHSSGVQKKPHHGRGTLKTCGAEGEGKECHCLVHGTAGTWCFQDACAVDSDGAEGVRCDNSGKLLTSPHVIGREPFSFWQTF